MNFFQMPCQVKISSALKSCFGPFGCVPPS